MSGRYENLRVVSAETGELCPRCSELEDQVDGLQRDIRGWTARYAELKRDKAKSAKQHKLWPDAVIAFKHWQAACNHPRSSFTVDRFWLVLPFLEDKEYGLKMVMRAIDGAAYDPWTTPRKNGSQKRHDSWELILRDTGHLEDFVNKAPIKETT